ncbi:bifunctional UDP-N-acetylglucosamine diphosphorylase/glucosamine-1-phosphate N-acetyltransferase GlmU [Prochlorococcus sp. MIT 1341]|uniref:bifunctional UDP-N-acetylglucosamine diphosphorylase/glucosamine-1-phosphate N-acetyltransferase GlmU n=1 Tax=Prochlorococcus sp. MIT 1341 TaxID=3096221 RepID=UPI002A761E59|nr:bifunctional UDP-N-acetylglucosamine diphosphorylase/glucosamine-1-phosphate N-acetyltransferase GlmU [Prochlorococcus sp. MIT 1341]
MLAIAVLAAGKGTRMKSALPKVLQTLGGTTLLERVLKSCQQLNPDRQLVIVGHKAEQIEKQMKDHINLEFVLQEPQNGTGHAVKQLDKVLQSFKGELLVLNGDVPLLSSETLIKLVTEHRRKKTSVTLLTALLENPTGYGRVFANEEGLVKRIVEDRDCNKEEKKNNLINSGIYCFDWQSLRKVLPKLNNNNSQGELYITDTIGMFESSRHIEVEDTNEVNGINNREQLSICEEYLQSKIRNHWMNEGVTFIHPSSCTISDNCKIGRDVVIEPQTHIRGKCIIGDSCRIGPGTFLNNSTLGKRVNAIYSVISESTVENDVSIGPFSHLRPGSNVSDRSRIGNFVEIKNSQIGRSSKVNHLSYIGDTKLGAEVNIGAGTITANFDGKQKHKTSIGDRSKTGANSVLVAPIILGQDVTVGAGSTLTKNVPSNALAISRSKQLIKESWIKISPP